MQNTPPTVTTQPPKCSGPRKLALLVALGLAQAAGPLHAAGFVETFANNPFSGGWDVAGDAWHFNWNAAQQNLEVTWDSARSNSFCFRPLPVALSRKNDFQLAFDLQLSQIQAGVNPVKPSTFEIAVGLIQRGSATHATFNRGTGRDSPNLVEFAYFPAADIIAATVSPVMVSSNNQFRPSFNYPLALTPGDLFHVHLRYAASNQTLVTTLTRNGAPFGPVKNVVLDTNFTDFRVDAVSVHSYSDHGDPWGSVWAQGTIDNLEVTWPDPPAVSLTGQWTNGAWQVLCPSEPGWTYTLERAQLLPAWQPLVSRLPGTGEVLTLADPNPPPGGALYRVRLEAP